MRLVAAAERDVQRARDDAIGRERSLAGQQPRILDALYARADVLRPQAKADIRAGEPERLLASVSHKNRPFSSGCPAEKEKILSKVQNAIRTLQDAAGGG